MRSPVAIACVLLAGCAHCPQPSPPKRITKTVERTEYIRPSVSPVPAWVFDECPTLGSTLPSRRRPTPFEWRAEIRFLRAYYRQCQSDKADESDWYKRTLGEIRHGG